MKKLLFLTSPQPLSCQERGFSLSQKTGNAPPSATAAAPNRRGGWGERWILLLLVAISQLSCTLDGHYKEHIEINDGVWNVKNEPTFDFEIDDPTKTYNVYYLIRCAAQYPYNNLYVKRFLYDDKKKLVSEALNELTISDEKTGKPLGDGLGDLFDYKIVTLKNHKFPHKGKYKMKIRQYMRQENLAGVLSVGLSIEENK